MRKDKKIGIGIGIAFVVLIILGIIGASLSPAEKDISSSASNNNNQATAAAATTNIKLGSKENPAKINDTVTVDNMDFTVVGINSSTEAGLEKAQGKFAIVSMTVENKAKESQTIGALNFNLLDAQDRKFDVSSATIYLDNGFFLAKSIQPGLPTRISVAFDVPSNQSYVMEISRSIFAEDKYFSIGTVA